MRIVLLSSFVPFINGGARFIVEWLEEKLRLAGHEVERFYLPFVEDPAEMMHQIAAYRLVDLTQSCDRVICFRPPAYVVDHPHKVLWFIHHIRAFYDLWDSPYNGMPKTAHTEAVRRGLIALDTQAIGEARAVFTNSQVVSDRLKRFNGIDSTPLYPPIHAPERFRHDGYGDAVVAVCRMEAHKRQALLIEAMAHTTSGVRLRLAGSASSPDHATELKTLIDRLGVADKVVFEDRWITEDEKADILAGALAVAYLPKDEDSYGYPSLEGAHARKAVLTTTDSGGVLELVEDGRNGLIVAPEPRAVAQAMDRLHRDRAATARMGAASHDRIAEMKIDWETVVNRLTA
ncbi:MAG: glycosyl transferase group 1 family protein LpsD [Caulobacter sp.]|nr:glycosyl transferase group 1 family protein LpsD [Caulobacter sp.]